MIRRSAHPVQLGAAPAKTNVFAETYMWQRVGSARAYLLPNPRLGQSPSGRQFLAVDKLVLQYLRPLTGHVRCRLHLRHHSKNLFSEARSCRLPLHEINCYSKIAWSVCGTWVHWLTNCAHDRCSILPGPTPHTPTAEWLARDQGFLRPRGCSRSLLRIGIARLRGQRYYSGPFQYLLR